MAIVLRSRCLAVSLLWALLCSLAFSLLPVQVHYSSKLSTENLQHLCFYSKAGTMNINEEGSTTFVLSIGFFMLKKSFSTEIIFQVHWIFIVDDKYDYYVWHKTHSLISYSSSFLPFTLYFFMYFHFVNFVYVL